MNEGRNDVTKGPTLRESVLSIFAESPGMALPSVSAIPLLEQFLRK